LPSSANNWRAAHVLWLRSPYRINFCDPFPAEYAQSSQPIERTVLRTGPCSCPPSLLHNHDTTCAVSYDKPHVIACGRVGEADGPSPLLPLMTFRATPFLRRRSMCSGNRMKPLASRQAQPAGTVEIVAAPALHERRSSFQHLFPPSLLVTSQRKTQLTERVLRNDQHDLVRPWLNAQVSQRSLRDRVHCSQREARANIRVIDDMQSICDCLDIVSRRNGYDVVLATDGKTS
jgi:hypothetical protein